MLLTHWLGLIKDRWNRRLTQVPRRARALRRRCRNRYAESVPERLEPRVVLTLDLPDPDLVTQVDATMVSDTGAVASTLTVSEIGRAMNADGRFVVFLSASPNLVPGQVDTNGTTDVFFRDLTTGTTTLVSRRDADGSAGNGESYDPMISPDGQWVVFKSDATNLSNTVTDTNGAGGDMYAWDRINNTLTLVTRQSAGLNATSATSLIRRGSRIASNSSGDTWVAFDSDSSDLTTGDGNGTTDVYAYRLSGTGAGTMQLVSRTASGTSGNNLSIVHDLAVRADGSPVVLFATRATDLNPAVTDTNSQYDLYAFDGTTLARSLITGTAASGGLTASALGWSPGFVARASGTISDDGTLVVFESAGNDLVAGQTDTNGNSDVFVRNLVTNTTSLVSYSTSATTAGNAYSAGGVISRDGSYIAFTTAASTLGSGLTDTNGRQDVFRYRVATGALELVSHAAGDPTTASNLQGSAGDGEIGISADGRYVAYSAEFHLDSNLISGLGYTGESADGIVRWSATTGENVLVSRRYGTSAGVLDSSSNLAGISGDGLRVLYVTAAIDSQGPSVKDFNLADDLFLYDEFAGTSIVSVRDANLPRLSQNRESSQIVSSASHDGRYVAFTSSSTDLVPLPQVWQQNSLFGSQSNVYLRDRLTGATTLVSSAAGGGPNVPANGNSFYPRISGDGRYLVYETQASNIVAGASDANGAVDVIRYDRLTGTSVIVSRLAGSGGSASANGNSSNAYISDDGDVIAFTSDASDLVSGYTGSATTQVFVYRVSTDEMRLVSHNSSSSTTAGNDRASFYTFVSGQFRSPLSADGTKLAFISRATNLVSGQTDTNLFDDAFYADLTPSVPTVTLVSRVQSTAAQTGNSGVDVVWISGDGTHVVLLSAASNLITGQVDNNSDRDVFVYTAGMDAAGVQGLTLVTKSEVTGESVAGYSDAPAISYDGRYVVFVTTATDYKAGVSDTNSATDIYLYDLLTDTRTLLSRSDMAGLVTGDGASYEPSMSGDPSNGTIVFSSDATNIRTTTPIVDANGLTDVFAYETVSTGGSTGVFRLISRDRGTSTTPALFWGAGSAIVSPNGTAILFVSDAPSIAPGDLNNKSDLLVQQVPEPPEAPTDILLSNGTVTENLPAGTVIGTLSAVDPNAGDAHTYSVISVSERTILLGVAGNSLVTRQPVDFETTPAFQVTIRVTDSSGLTYDKTFTIDVLDANDPPTDITLRADLAFDLVDGLSLVATDVRTMESTDPDDGVQSIFTLVAGPGDGDNARFDISDNRLSFTGDINFEVQRAYSIRLRATDLSGAFFEKSFTLRVIDQAEPGPSIVSGIDNPANSANRSDTPNLASYPTDSRGSRSISADGRYVIFSSEGRNVVAGMTFAASNMPINLFQYDRATGAVTLISHTAASLLEAGGYQAERVAMSADGRFVAYTSFAHLHQGIPSVGSYANLYLWDRDTGENKLISRAFGSPNTPANRSIPATGTGALFLSDDGRFLAFEDGGDNLVDGQVDTNGDRDVFLYDRLNDSIQLVSHAIGSTTTTLTSGTYLDALSGDGLSIAMTTFDAAMNVVPGLTDSSLGPDLYLFSVVTGQRQLVNHVAGDPLNTSNEGQTSSFFPPTFSFDGRYLLFKNGSNNLVSGQSAGNPEAWYLYDSQTDTSTLVTRSDADPLQPIAADFARIARNGQFVVFTSRLSGFTATDGGTTGDINNDRDVYRYRVSDGAVVQVTHASGDPATPSNYAQEPASISDDGRFVLYTIGDGRANFVNNAVTEDFPVFTSFLYDFDTNVPTLISHRGSDPNITANSSSLFSELSGDGQFVVWEFQGAGSEPGNAYTDGGVKDFNRKTDVVLFSRFDATNALVSRADEPDLSGINADGLGSLLPQQIAVSDNGRYVAFASRAMNLTGGIGYRDGNSSFDYDIFLHDRQTNTTLLVSRSHIDPQQSANGNSFHPVISGDGRYVAYLSRATDLVDGLMTYHTEYDLFLFDRDTGTNTLITSASPTAEGNLGLDLGTDPDLLDETFYNIDSLRNSFQISRDGAYIAFASRATDLVAGFTDNNGTGAVGGYGNIVGGTDLYVYEVATGTIRLVSGVAGSTTAGGNGASFRPTLSDDGMRIAFLSQANDLIAGGTFIPGTTQAYVYDWNDGSLRLVSHSSSSSDEGGNGNTTQAVISGNGQRVAFISYASNVGPNSHVDANGQADVFLHFIDGDVGLGFPPGENRFVTGLRSNMLQAANGGADEYALAISVDGRYVAYLSDASDMTTPETNYPAGPMKNAFLYDASTFMNRLVSRTVASLTEAGDQPVVGVAMDGNGENVLFLSSADLMPADTFVPTVQVYRWNRLADLTTLVSRQADSGHVGSGNQATLQMAISRDGSSAYFATGSDNIAAGDYNGAMDLFLATFTPPNQVPTDITLNNDIVVEGRGTGLVVSHLFANDPDGGSHTWELVAGVGDTDNAKFAITSGFAMLVFDDTANLATQSSYSIRVRVTDSSAGGSFEKVLTINVLAANTLSIAGTAGNDVVEIRVQDGVLYVYRNGTIFMNGYLAGLSGIEADLGDGANDVLQVNFLDDSVLDLPISVLGTESVFVTGSSDNERLAAHEVAGSLLLTRSIEFQPGEFTGPAEFLTWQPPLNAALRMSGGLGSDALRLWDTVAGLFPSPGQIETTGFESYRVSGTAGADEYSVTLNSSDLRVTLPGLSRGLIRISDPGTISLFEIQGDEGNDTLSFLIDNTSVFTGIVRFDGGTGSTDGVSITLPGGAATPEFVLVGVESADVYGGSSAEQFSLTGDTSATLSLSRAVDTGSGFVTQSPLITWENGDAAGTGLFISAGLGSDQFVDTAAVSLAAELGISLSGVELIDYRGSYNGFQDAQLVLESDLAIIKDIGGTRTLVQTTGAADIDGIVLGAAEYLTIRLDPGSEFTGLLDVLSNVSSQEVLVDGFGGHVRATMQVPPSVSITQPAFTQIFADDGRPLNMTMRIRPGIRWTKYLNLETYTLELGGDTTTVNVTWQADGSLLVDPVASGQLIRLLGEIPLSVTGTSADETVTVDAGGLSSGSLALGTINLGGGNDTLTGAGGTVSATSILNVETISGVSLPTYTIDGTVGDDLFQVWWSGATLHVLNAANSDSWAFDPSGYSQVIFDGIGGTDSIDYDLSGWVAGPPTTLRSIESFTANGTSAAEEYFYLQDVTAGLVRLSYSPSIATPAFETVFEWEPTSARSFALIGGGGTDRFDSSWTGSDSQSVTSTVTGVEIIQAGSTHNGAYGRTVDFSDTSIVEKDTTTGFVLMTVLDAANVIQFRAANGDVRVINVYGDSQFTGQMVVPYVTTTDRVVVNATGATPLTATAQGIPNAAMNIVVPKPGGAMQINVAQQHQLVRLNGFSEVTLDWSAATEATSVLFQESGGLTDVISPQFGPTLRFSSTLLSLAGSTFADTVTIDASVTELALNQVDLKGGASTDSITSAGTATVAGLTGVESLTVNGGLFTVQAQPSLRDLTVNDGQLDLQTGAMVVGQFTQTGGEIIRGGLLEIDTSAANSFVWSGGMQSGPGNTSLSGATATGAITGVVTMLGGMLVNQATLTLGNDGVTATTYAGEGWSAGQLDNAGLVVLKGATVEGRVINRAGAEVRQQSLTTSNLNVYLEDQGGIIRSAMGDMSWYGGPGGLLAGTQFIADAGAALGIQLGHAKLFTVTGGVTFSGGGTISNHSINWQGTGDLVFDFAPGGSFNGVVSYYALAGELIVREGTVDISYSVTLDMPVTVEDGGRFSSTHLFDYPSVFNQPITVEAGGQLVGSGYNETYYHTEYGDVILTPGGEFVLTAIRTTPGNGVTFVDSIDLGGGTLSFDHTQFPLGGTYQFLKAPNRAAITGQFANAPFDVPFVQGGRQYLLEADADGWVTLRSLYASTVYVNSTWTGLSSGVDPDGAGPATAIGYDAFADLSVALTSVAVTGTVIVPVGGTASLVGTHTLDTRNLLNQGTLTLGDGGTTPTEITGGNFTNESLLILRGLLWNGAAVINEAGAEIRHDSAVNSTVTNVLIDRGGTIRGITGQLYFGTLHMEFNGTTLTTDAGGATLRIQTVANAANLVGNVLVRGSGAVVFASFNAVGSGNFDILTTGPFATSFSTVNLASTGTIVIHEGEAGFEGDGPVNMPIVVEDGGVFSNIRPSGNPTNFLQTITVQAGGRIENAHPILVSILGDVVLSSGAVLEFTTTTYSVDTIDLGGATLAFDHTQLPLGASHQILKAPNRAAITGQFGNAAFDTPFVQGGRQYVLEADTDGWVTLRSLYASTVYVSSTWTGLSSGVDPDGAGPATAIGYDAFASLDTAVGALADGGTAYVLAGSTNQLTGILSLGSRLIVNQGDLTIGTGTRSETEITGGRFRNETNQFWLRGVYFDGTTITNITGGIISLGIAEDTYFGGTLIDDHGAIRALGSSFAGSFTGEFDGTVFQFNNGHGFALSGTATLGPSPVTLQSTTSGVFELGTASWSGTDSLVVDVTGSGYVVVTNEATLSLTIGVWVREGRLQIERGATIGSPVTVEDGGILAGGSGWLGTETTVTGTVTVESGGRLSLPDGTGVPLRFAAVVMQSGSTLFAPADAQTIQVDTIDLGNATLEFPAPPSGGGGVSFGAALIGGATVDILKAPTSSAVTGRFSNAEFGVPFVAHSTVYSLDLLSDGTVRLARPNVVEVFVDPAWTGLAIGVDPDGAGPRVAIGHDSFATIQLAVDAVSDGGTVRIAAGSYLENVTTAKSVTLIGADENTPSATTIVADTGNGLTGTGFGQYLSLQHLMISAASGRPLRTTGAMSVELIGVLMSGGLSSELVTTSFSVSLPDGFGSGTFIEVSGTRFDSLPTGGIDLLGPLYISVNADTGDSDVRVTPGSSATTIWLTTGGTTGDDSLLLRNTGLAGTQRSGTPSSGNVSFSNAGSVYWTGFASTSLEVNTAPSITGLSGTTGDRLGTYTAGIQPIPVSLTDAEDADSALIVTFSSSNPAIVLNSGISYSGGAISVSPEYQAVGTTTITVTVTDQNGLSVSDTFVVTLLADAVLSTGTGDGTARVTVDPYGEFRTAIYDPIGPLGEDSTTYRSHVIIRGDFGEGPVAAPLSQLGTLVSFTSDGTRATSVFTLLGFQITLTQWIDSLRDGSGAPTGSVLIQEAAITNLSGSAVPVPFELIRYFDSDLEFDGVIQDGGGRLVQGGEEILFATDRGVNPLETTTFVGITATGGSTTGPGRYDIDGYSVLVGRIAGSELLRDLVTGDGDSNGFVDAGGEYDLALALRNTFAIAGGASATYRTQTYFGRGTPSGAINQPPTLAPIPDRVGPEDVPLMVPLIAFDPDGPAGLVVTASSSNPSVVAAGGLVVVGNSLNVTPVANASGTTTITVTVRDPAGATAIRSFVLTVLPINDPPVVGATSLAMPEDAAATTLPLTITDVDDPVGSLVVTATELPGGSGSLLAGVTPTFVSGTWRLLVTPRADAFGTTTIRVRAQDVGGMFSERDIPVTITAVNDAPTIGATSLTILEDALATTLPLTIADFDNPIGSLVVTATEQPGGAGSLLATVTPEFVGGAWRLTVTPRTNAFGTTTIRVRAQDAGGLFSERDLPVTITAVNDAPTNVSLSNSSVRAGDAGAVVGTVSATDIDETGTLTFSLGGVDASEFVLVGNQLRVGPVGLNPAGPSTRNLTIRATDSGGLLAELAVTITVTPPNAGDLRVRLFHDLNQDGVRQSGGATNEPGLAGFVVYVDGNDNALLDPGELTATTNGTGDSVFTGITPGSYRVRQIIPAGWRQTTPATSFVDVTVVGGGLVTAELGDADDHADRGPGATVVSVTAGGSTTVTGGMQSTADVDLFRVSAPETGLLSISVIRSAGTLDPVLRVYRLTPTGREFVDADDVGGQIRTRLVQLSVTAGEVYEFEVSGFGGTLGGYSASVRSTAAVVDDYGDTFTGAPVENVGAAALTQAGAINSSGDIDFFRIQPRESGLLRVGIATTTGGAAPQIVLYSGDRRLLQLGDPATGVLRANVRAGETYYLAVVGTGTNTGGYEWTATIVVNDAGSDFGSATDLVADPATGDFIREGVIATAGETDVLRFIAQATGRATVDLTALTGSSLDTYLTAFSAGTGSGPVFLALNDDISASSRDSSLSFDVVAGRTYYLEVRGFADTTGGYRLRVRTITPDDHGNITADATPLSVALDTPTSGTGTLTSGDVDVFSFIAPADGNVSLQVDRTGGGTSTIEAAVVDWNLTRVVRSSQTGDTAANLTFSVTANRRYFVRLSRAADGLADVTFRITLRAVEALVPVEEPILDDRAAEALQLDLDQSVQAGQAEVTTATGTTPDADSRINELIVEKFVNYFGGLSAFSEPVLFIWFDPIDFIVTDPQSRQVGYTASQGSVNEVGSGVRYSGNGATEWLVIPQAQAAGYNLQLVGVGASQYRYGANYISSSGVESVTAQGSLLKGDANLVLDFTGKSTGGSGSGSGTTSSGSGRGGGGGGGGILFIDVGGAPTNAIRGTFAFGGGGGGGGGGSGGATAGGGIRLGEGDRQSAGGGANGPARGVGGSAGAGGNRSLASHLMNIVDLPFNSLLGRRNGQNSAASQRAMGEFWSVVGRRLVTLPQLPAATPSLEDVLDWLQKPISPDEPAAGGDKPAREAPRENNPNANGDAQGAKPGANDAKAPNEKQADERPEARGEKKAAADAPAAGERKSTSREPVRDRNRANRDRERIETARRELRRMLQATEPQRVTAQVAARTENRLGVGS